MTKERIELVGREGSALFHTLLHPLLLTVWIEFFIGKEHPPQLAVRERIPSLSEVSL